MFRYVDSKDEELLISSSSRFRDLRIISQDTFISDEKMILLNIDIY